MSKAAVKVLHSTCPLSHGRLFVTPWIVAELSNLSSHHKLYVESVCIICDRNLFLGRIQFRKAILCPHWCLVSAGEWINNTHTIEYYSAPKINELTSHRKTWRHLKCVLLSERSQSEKATYCLIHTIRHFGNGKTMKTVKYYRSLALETNEQAQYREFLGW